MFYAEYTVGGELYHAGNHKYLDKVKTKSGKWRYIYTRATAGVQRAENVDQALLNKKKDDSNPLNSFRNRKEEIRSSKTIKNTNRRLNSYNKIKSLLSDKKVMNSTIKELAEKKEDAASTTSSSNKGKTSGTSSKSKKTKGRKGKSYSSEKKQKSSSGSSKEKSSSSSKEKLEKEDPKDRALRNERVIQIQRLSGNKYKNEELLNMKLDDLNNLWKKLDDKDKKEDKVLRKRQKKTLDEMSKKLKTKKDRSKQAKETLDNYIYRNVNKTFNDTKSAVNIFEKIRR